MTQVPSLTQNKVFNEVSNHFRKQISHSIFSRNADADSYFRDISYIVNLEDLYEMVDSCYYDDQLDHVPVLFMIKQEHILPQQGNQPYLLQVNLEDKFLAKIQLWSIQKDYLIYVDEGDPENSVINIVYFRQDGEDCQVLKINGFSDPTRSDFTELQNPQEFETPSRIIEAFFAQAVAFSESYDDNQPSLVIVFESLQNKLDFKIAQISSNEILDGGDNDSLSLRSEPDLEPVANDSKLVYKQIRNVSDREKTYIISPTQKIKKMSYVIENKRLFAIVMRESGEYDFYTDMKHENLRQLLPDFAINNIKIGRCTDIGIGFKSFYLQFQEANQSKYYCELEHRGKTRVSLSDMKKASDIDTSIAFCAKKRTFPYVYLYSDFEMYTELGGDTLCLVAHRNYVSIYSLLDKKWKEHINFCQDIAKIFRQNLSFDEKKMKISVLLQNGDVYSDITKYFYYLGNPVYKDEAAYTLEHSIASCIKFDAEFEDENGSTQLLPCLVINDPQQIELILLADSEQYDFKKQGQIIDIKQVKVDFNHKEKFQDKFEKLYFLARNNEGLALIQLATHPSNIAQNILQIYWGDIDFDMEFDKIHTIYSSDPKKIFIFFSDSQVFIYSVKEMKKIHMIEEFFCKAIICFREGLCYGLFKEADKSESHGLKQIDIQALEKGEKKVKLLKKMEVGGHTLMIEDSQAERIGFLSSFSSIIVCPFLHSNVHKLMGAVTDVSMIKLAKVADYTLIALIEERDHCQDKLYLKTWDLISGKLINSKDFEYIDILDTYSFYLNHEYSSKTRVDKHYLLLKKNSRVQTQPSLILKNNETQPAISSDKLASVLIEEAKNSHFIVFQINDKKEAQGSLQFNFPVHKEQKMFLNSNLDRLIVIYGNDRVIVYGKSSEAFTAEGYPTIPSVKWAQLKELLKFPFNLESKIIKDRLYCFSDDFRFFIRMSTLSKQFEIYQTDTMERHSQVPNHIISYQKSTNTRDLLRQFKWYDGNRFIICDQNGYERLINIDTYEEEAYNGIPLFETLVKPNFETEINGSIKNKRLYHHSISLPKNDTLQRLKLMYTHYKSDYYLHRKKGQQLYQSLINVDPEDLTCFQHSFTFLNFSLFDQLKRKDIKLKHLSEQTQKYMVYNILPGGNTILHNFCYSQKKIAKIYQLCHKEDKIVYHLPFLHNIDGASPLDLSISLNQSDLRSIFSVINYLKLYPIDHHSRALCSFYSKMIEEDIPELIEYFESRFFCNTVELESINSGQIVDSIISSSLSLDKNYTIDRMLGGNEIGSSIKIEILDMPNVYHYDDVQFKGLFAALSQSKSFTIFQSRAIQSLIDLNYPLVRKYMIYFIIFPFLVFHGIFVFYMNLVYEKSLVDPDLETAYIVLSSIQIAFAAYFLCLEINQAFEQRLEYFKVIWNYVDFFAPSGVIIVHSLNFAEAHGHEINQHLDRTIVALSTLLMWTKLITSLRLFRNTSYLLRAITEVIKDMGVFLFVLLIAITGFGDTFLKISLGNEEEKQFIPNFFDGILYTYSMNLGGYDLESFGDVAKPLMHILWIMCTILIMIVMLNLLIAIISSSYERVVDNQDQASHQETAALISENFFLIPRQIRKNYAKMNRFLLIGTDLEQVDIIRDPIAKNFNKIQSAIQDMKKQIEVNKDLIETKMHANEEALIKQDKENKKAIGDVKLLLMKLSPPEKVNVKCHPSPLTKMLLIQIQEIHNFESYFGWNCDGMKINGCLSSITGDQPNDLMEEEKLYFCEKCKFIYCAKCKAQYYHIHPLKEYKASQLTEKGFEMECYGKQMKPCIRGLEQDNSDPYEILYHDDTVNNGYDFCEDCIKIYRVYDDSK